MRYCYIYIRVSTEEQAKEGFSIDNQKRACIEYAKNNGYEVKEIFADEGKSARTTDRPAFQKLLKALKENLVEAVIVYKIDRFARNVADFSNTRKQLKSQNIKLLSMNEGGDVTEGLIGNIFASVAEWESDVNGQRTRDALIQKFREGWWPGGRPPLGYKNAQVGDKRIIVIDKKVAPLMKEAFRLYSTGAYSLLELSRDMYEKGLTARGGKMLSDSSLQQHLSNTFYYGLMSWGKPVRMEKIGKHKPLITKTLYDQCQYIASKHANFLIRKRIHTFLLRGFVFCPVHNKRLTAEWHYYHHANYKKQKIGYYHCPQQGGCKSSYIECTRLEKAVSKLIKKYEFSSEFINLVQKRVRSYFEDTKEGINSQKQALINQRKALEAKRNKLEDLIVDGTIDRNVFKRQHDQLQNQILQIDNQTMELESTRQFDVNLIDEVLAMTRNIYQTYLDAPEFLKRHYLRFFFEQIFVKEGKISKVTETPVFSTLRRQHYLLIRNRQLPGLDSDQRPYSYNSPSVTKRIGLSYPA